MELASPLVIESLIAQNGPRRIARPRATLADPVPTRVSRRRGCTCGICRHCIENARWDKIFNEKFADPNYYRPKPIHVGSSLGWLR